MMVFFIKGGKGPTWYAVRYPHILPDGAAAATATAAPLVLS